MIAREELQRGAARPRSLVDLFEATAAQRAGRTATKEKRNGRWVDTSWGELARRARDIADGLASISLGDPACFIYTSGTTGNPKGAVLTHGNWVYEAEAVESLQIIRDDDLVLCFLPMAHSFAQVIGAVWLKVGATAAFVESIDKIVDNAHEVRPTVMPSVPRIFEKAYDAVVSKGLSTPGLKGKLFKLALASLDRFVDAHERGQDGTSLGLLVARRLVFPKLPAALAERFGGRLRL